MLLKKRRFWRSLMLPLGLALMTTFAHGSASPSLVKGYRLMYGLKFDEAKAEIDRWKAQNPGDPRGPVSRAANILFEEFERLEILEAQFFVEDSRFENRPKPTPDPKIRERFESHLEAAEKAAEQCLERKPEDRDALFAMTLVHGLKADYLALIEKKNMAALDHTRKASRWAKRLLEVAPDYYDAYLAPGVSNYIIGSLFAPVRWILRLGGYSGNKEEGMRQLQLTARHGCLLAPFARILLAISHLRAGEEERARQLLVGLRQEFPSNPLFAREIDRIDAKKK
jgi:hypothetical protein